MIIDTLIEKIRASNCPVCVGLDPQPDFVPEFIKAKNRELYGPTLKAAAQAFLEFNKLLIDSFYDIVPSVKPQIAFYERFGFEGAAAYAETAAYAKSKGLVVIGDVKRGDIASTAAAYSDGHIGEVCVDGKSFRPFNEDMITINPYLGRDSIEPFFDNIKKHNTGVFILVKTSNAGSGDLQDLPLANGSPLYEHVGCLVSKWGEEFTGKYGYSSLGAVVGATWPKQAARLRELMPRTFFLIPGYGAQGGKAEDLAVCFDKNGLGGIVNSSRGIIAAWKKPEYSGRPETEFAACARAEVLKMKEDLGRHIYE